MGTGDASNTFIPLLLIFSIIPRDHFGSPHSPWWDTSLLRTQQITSMYNLIISQFNLIFEHPSFGFSLKTSALFCFQAPALPEALYLSRVMLWGVTAPVVSCEEGWNIFLHGILPTAVIAVCKFILSTVWSSQPCRRATLPLKLWRHEFYIQFALEQDGTCYQVLFPP